MKNLIAFLGGFVSMVVAGVASAAITAADLAGVGTEITTDAATVMTWVLPIIGTVLAATIGIKLMKRLANKV